MHSHHTCSRPPMAQTLSFKYRCIFFHLHFFLHFLFHSLFYFIYLKNNIVFYMVPEVSDSKFWAIAAMSLFATRTCSSSKAILLKTGDPGPLDLTSSSQRPASTRRMRQAKPRRFCISSAQKLAAFMIHSSSQTPQIERRWPLSSRSSLRTANRERTSPSSATNSSPGRKLMVSPLISFCSILDEKQNTANFQPSKKASSAIASWPG